MPSYSYRQWRTVRARALDEMAEAHAAIGGTARGRRFATQQINRGYAVLLAAQFQGFCRDLHSECVDHILDVIAPSPPLYQILLGELTRGRQLDRGNAQPGSLGADFRRLGVELWPALSHGSASAERWKHELDLLNEWRNAIVHEDFTSARLTGIMNLQLNQVRRWRRTCGRLAKAMDEVMWRYLEQKTGVAPW
jgi:hypothetical protein